MARPNPSDIGAGDQARALERESREFCPAVPDDLNMPRVPDAPTLEDPY